MDNINDHDRVLPLLGGDADDLPDDADDHDLLDDDDWGGGDWDDDDDLPDVEEVAGDPADAGD